MSVLAPATVAPCHRVIGRIRVPGDKSISHRYALLAALADGTSRLQHYAPGADCVATLACLRALGVSIDREPQSAADPAAVSTVVVRGRGLRGLQPPDGPLDTRNSGTAMRLLAGVLAAHPFSATLVGDASLSRRPMQRVIDPLDAMGASIGSQNGRPPLIVRGGRLQGITFRPEVPSAQVKSAVLLAGLQADGETVVVEAVPTRNHTELALSTFGVSLEARPGRVALQGGQPLEARVLAVPGDLSSAIFWAVAAAALPGSDVEIVDVGLNPSRTAVLDLLRRFGARVETRGEADEQPAAGREPRGTLRVAHHALEAVEVGADEVPGLIDELPALAALATFGGELRVTGASELRVKESDRISALVTGLRTLGATVDELPDGFHVRRGAPLRGGHVDPAGDHRLAMAFAIAGLGATGPTTIAEPEAVDVSYPGFFQTLADLRVP